MTSAAAPSRLLASACAVASVLAFVLAARADGAARSWTAFLAPSGACRSADDPAAASDVQARAVTCLVNWARTQDQRSRLVGRSALRRAAALKGERVASCQQFSHTPCGVAATSAVNAVGYRYTMFGENLYAGTWGVVSPRDVVRAWLESPPHRANILDRRFRHIGIAPVRANGLLDGADAVVWTATFAAPR